MDLKENFNDVKRVMACCTFVYVASFLAFLYAHNMFTYTCLQDGGGRGIAAAEKPHTALICLHTKPTNLLLTGLRFSFDGIAIVVIICYCLLLLLGNYLESIIDPILPIRTAAAVIECKGSGKGNPLYFVEPFRAKAPLSKLECYCLLVVVFILLLLLLGNRTPS